MDKWRWIFVIGPVDVGYARKSGIHMNVRMALLSIMDATLILTGPHAREQQRILVEGAEIDMDQVGSCGPCNTRNIE
jgi:hypothetical protein